MASSQSRGRTVAGRNGRIRGVDRLGPFTPLANPPLVLSLCRWHKGPDVCTDGYRSMLISTASAEMQLLRTRTPSLSTGGFSSPARPADVPSAVARRTEPPCSSPDCLAFASATQGRGCHVRDAKCRGCPHCLFCHCALARDAAKGKAFWADDRKAVSESHLAVLSRLDGPESHLSTMCLLAPRLGTRVPPERFSGSSRATGSVVPFNKTGIVPASISVRESGDSLVGGAVKISAGSCRS